MIRFQRKKDTTKVQDPLQRAITCILWVMDYALNNRQIHRSPNLSRKPASQTLMEIIHKKLFHKSFQKLIDTEQKAKFIRKLETITIKELEPKLNHSELTSSDIDNAWIKIIHQNIAAISQQIPKAMDPMAHDHFSLACHALMAQAKAKSLKDPQMALLPMQLLMQGLRIKDQPFLCELIYQYFHFCHLTIQAANNRDYKSNVKKDDTALDNDTGVYFAKLFAPVIHNIVQFQVSDNLKECYDFSSTLVALICSTRYFESPTSKNIDHRLDSSSLEDFKSTVQKLFHTWSIRRKHAGPTMPSGHKHGIVQSFKNCLKSIQQDNNLSLIESMRSTTSVHSELIPTQGGFQGDIMLCYRLVLQLGLLDSFIHIDPVTTTEYIHQVLLCMHEVFLAFQHSSTEDTVTETKGLTFSPPALIYRTSQPTRENEASLTEDLKRLSLNESKQKFHL